MDWGGSGLEVEPEVLGVGAQAKEKDSPKLGRPDLIALSPWGRVERDPWFFKGGGKKKKKITSSPPVVNDPA